MADDARPDLIERLRDYAARLWQPSNGAQLFLEAAEALTAERELCEKYRIAATVMCGAHIGVPQDSCPVCALTAERARRQQAEQEREHFYKAFLEACGDWRACDDDRNQALDDLQAIALGLSPSGAEP